jgi:hypothetical protein
MTTPDFYETKLDTAFLVGKEGQLHIRCRAMVDAVKS